jgi:hypothetical protein
MKNCVVCSQGCISLLRQLQDYPDMPADAIAAWDVFLDACFALSHFSKCGWLPADALKELGGGLVGGILMKDVDSASAEAQISKECLEAKRLNPSTAPTCSDFKADAMDVRYALPGYLQLRIQREWICACSHFDARVINGVPFLGNVESLSTVTILFCHLSTKIF